MATQRFVSTGLWRDRWFLGLTAIERDLWIYLLTNPDSNIAGVYQVSLRIVAIDLSSPDREICENDVVNALRKFEEDQRCYLRKEWIVLRKAPHHQRVGERGSLRLGLIKIMRSIPEWLKLMICSGEIKYEFPLEEIWTDAYQITNKGGDYRETGNGLVTDAGGTALRSDPTRPDLTESDPISASAHEVPAAEEEDNPFPAQNDAAPPGANGSGKERIVAGIQRLADTPLARRQAERSRSP